MPSANDRLLLSILILAGGRSRRMGRDKAWLEYDGIPLIEHIARRLSPLAAEFIISAADPAPFHVLAERVPVPMAPVADIFPGAGPLAGLHAGLSLAQEPLVFAVATDMPFVNLELVQHMAEIAQGFDAVIPLTPNAGEATPQPEPLHAIYRRTCLSAITRQLELGARRMIGFLPEVKARYLDPAEIAAFDPDFLSFINVNTPDDWEAARRRLSGRG